MLKLQTMFVQLKSKWKMILRTLMFVGLIVLLAGGAYYIYWINYEEVRPKVVSGISLFRKPVIVSVNGQTKELNSFDTYEFTLTTKDEIVVRLTDVEGNLISERKHQPDYMKGVAVDYFIEDKNIQQCFVMVNATPLFYPGTKESREITEFSQVGNTPNSVYYTQNFMHDMFVHPGKYDGETLPPELLLAQRVWGIYPIECASVADKAKVNEQILWWTNYDSAQQRELYAKKVQELAAL